MATLLKTKPADWIKRGLWVDEMGTKLGGAMDVHPALDNDAVSNINAEVTTCWVWGASGA